MNRKKNEKQQLHIDLEIKFSKDNAALLAEYYLLQLSVVFQRMCRVSCQKEVLWIPDLDSPKEMKTEDEASHTYRNLRPLKSHLFTEKD